MIGEKGISRKIVILAIVIVIVVASIIGAIYYLTLPSKKPKPAAPVYLVPSEIKFDVTEVSVGDRFNVSVWVSNATDLFGYQVALYYNSTVINVTNAWQPSWNSSYVFYEKTGELLGPMYGNFSSWGSCLIGFSLLKGTESFTGDGLLAVFEFEITAPPAVGLTSDLIISAIPSGIPSEQAFETKLKDSKNDPILITATDGTYEYTS